MKKILALILAALLTFTLCACGGDKSDTGKQVQSSGNFDLDIASMNKTMQIGQMQSIKSDFNKYIDKTIRINGFYQEQPGELATYKFVIGYDETACCAAWDIELYGDKIPTGIKNNTEITVEGKLGQYDENGQMYPAIFVDKLVMN